MHRSPLALTVALTLGLSSPASAQDDFSRLKVKLGQIVYVADASTGVEVSGPLTSLAPRDLSIDGYRFQPKPGLKIERAGDSVWDGAALGFGVACSMAARWCCLSVSRPDHEPAVCWDRRLDSQRSAHSSTMRPSAARRSTKERGPAQGPTRSAARRSASCRRSTRIEKRLRWPFDSDERYLPSLLNPRSLSRPSFRP